MKLVHAPEYYRAVPRPHYNVNLRGDSMFLFCSTQLTGTMREAPPDLFAPVPHFVGIDFEGEDVSKWLEEMNNQVAGSWNIYFKRDLFVTGRLFRGSFPVEYERDNVWKCSFDYEEEVMSHKQFYRSKDFPLTATRYEFNTFEGFKSILSRPDVQHVIVDALTHQCLAEGFEDFQDEAQIASTEDRKQGLILRFGQKLVFADTYLPNDRQWVNVNPGNPSARPQFLVVDTSTAKPWPSIG
jgi:hypothetical protein